MNLFYILISERMQDKAFLSLHSNQCYHDVDYCLQHSIIENGC